MTLTHIADLEIAKFYQDPDGNVLVRTKAEDGLAIAKGDVGGTSVVHKFGNAPDFDSTDLSVTIWDGADDGDINQMAYVYSATANIDSISSNDNGDTQDYEIQGLDANYSMVIQTITATGQTRKALTTPLLRVFRVKNVGTTNNAGHIYIYVNTTLSSGVPTTSTLVRAVVQPLNNQTLMALYTVPLGKTAYMRKWYANSAGASKATNYVIDIFARPFGQVFQLKNRSSISDTGSSENKHDYFDPEVFAAKTDIEMKVKIAESSKTAASVSGGFDLVLVDD